MLFTGPQLNGVPMPIPIRRLTAATLIVGLASMPADALTTDAPMIGDCACSGDLRAYITALGSIELLGGDPSYRAGLIDVEGDAMTITWDEGGETTVTWTLADGTLTLEGLTDEPLICTPR